MVTDEQIREGMAENLCRCGVHDRVRRAVDGRVPGAEIDSEQQLRIHRVTLHGEPELLPGAREFVETLPETHPGPRYYLDFEAIGSPIPMNTTLNGRPARSTQRCSTARRSSSISSPMRSRRTRTRSRSMSDSGCSRSATTR